MNYTTGGFACTNEDEVAREGAERFVLPTRPPAMQALCLNSWSSKLAKNMKFPSEQRIPQWKMHKKESRLEYVNFCFLLRFHSVYAYLPKFLN